MHAIGDGCGIYAYKEPVAWTNRAGSTTGTVWVVGTVLLWGALFEHEQGYRAEYGQVVELVNTHQLARELARIYKVPLIDLDEYERSRSR